MRSSVTHLRQAIGTQQERVVRVQLNPVALHSHPRLMAPDGVGNDVAEAMMRRLFRLKLAPANHLFNEGVVVGQAVQLPSPE